MSKKSTKKLPSKKNLSDEDYKEYEDLCDLCESLSDISANTEITVDIPALGFKKTITVNNCFSLEWEEGDSPNIWSEFDDRNGEVENFDLSSLKDDVYESCTSKIKEVCDRIDAWEAKTGMEFDGYY